MSWLLYFLVFIFGYLTCKAAHYIGAAKTGIRVVRNAQLIYLSVVLKSLENLSYSREMTLESLLRSEKQSAEISSFQYKFEEEVRFIKARCIEQLIDEHPPGFRNIIEFKDWETSMAFLTKHKPSVLQFWGYND